MWEHGYSSDDANEVCHRLSEWVQTALSLPGECLVLWSKQDGIRFTGDSELVYAMSGTAYLLPNPFLEGDPEGFIVAMQKIVEGHVSELFAIELQSRVLYNAS